MKRRDQQRIVKELTNMIRDEVLMHITTQRIPEEWDGHELRQLLADKFAEAASRSFGGGPRVKRLKRYKDYLNVVITEDL